MAATGRRRLFCSWAFSSAPTIVLTRFRIVWNPTKGNLTITEREIGELMGIYEQWEGLTNRSNYQNTFPNQSDGPSCLKPHYN